MMSLRNTIALLSVCAMTAACGGGETTTPATETTAPAAEAATAGAKGTASISGKISFDGTPPAPEKVKLSADPKCVEMHKGGGLERQPIKVDKDGGLADVFIYVKSGLTGSYPAPTEPVVLAQKGCDYDPHMIALQVGQPLQIINDDDTLHNIHPRPKQNEEFNIGQPRQGMESTRTFDKPETMIPVGCDVHPWMRAFINVVDNPFYAVTGNDGTFKIEGLPAGEYEIEALHDSLPAQTSKVTVKDGEAATLNLTFKG